MLTTPTQLVKGSPITKLPCRVAVCSVLMRYIDSLHATTPTNVATPMAGISSSIEGTIGTGSQGNF